MAYEPGSLDKLGYINLLKCSGSVSDAEIWKLKAFLVWVLEVVVLT